MKTHPYDPRIRKTRVGPIGWVFLLPIVMVSIHAQLPDLTIGVDSVLLTWAPTGEECIVVCAESPDGPWTPVPVPIREVDGQCQAVVKCSDQQQYFRLRKGTCFMEDFNDGLAEGWTIHYLSPEAEEKLNLEYDCGHLRLTCTDFGEPAPATFERDGLVAGDFALLIDILDWNPDSTDRLIVSPYANLQFDGGDANESIVYLSGWTIIDPENSGDSGLWIMRWETEDNWRNLFSPLRFAQQRPDHTYRLVVTGTRVEFGPFGRYKLTIQLFNRDTGELIKEATTWDSSPLPPGTVGFIIYGAQDGTGTIDVTLDNFIAVVTPPQ